MVPDYFRRFGARPPLVPAPPAPGLAWVIVIPCLAEPDLMRCLESIRACHRSSWPVEVLVVLNSPADAGREVLDQNADTRAQAHHWMRGHGDPGIRFHLLDCQGLPRRHAGVGMARKIGMDEALRRLGRGRGLNQGVIVCLDADCECDRNYLVALEDHFASHPGTPGCSLYFEHPLEGALPEICYRAVAAYELHLRYYVEALRYAGLPCAYHTLGSCMAVRAPVYAAAGGMNRRKAGEDFYFLQKIIPLGGFTELNTTTVRPAPRFSDRVPFGTGRAISEYRQTRRQTTYALDTFRHLGALARYVNGLARVPRRGSEPLASRLAPPLWRFLNRAGFESAWDEIRTHVSTIEAFRTRFFRWFNGFRCMKYANDLSEHGWPRRPVEVEAALLLAQTGSGERSCRRRETLELLEVYRCLQRRHVPSAFSAGAIKPVHLNLGL